MMLRANMHARVKAGARKKPKEVCPECGKDIHDADCAYRESGR
jgi:hypothetical protein